MKKPSAFFSMKNTIAERIYDFLKNYPPFDLLAGEKLMAVCREIQVRHVEAGQRIFQQGDQPHQVFYVLREGDIGLWKELENESILLDVCDEGDVFGLRPLLQSDSYRMTAKARAESLIYEIEIEHFNQISFGLDKVRKFLELSYSVKVKEGVQIRTGFESVYDETLRAHFSKNPVSCDESSSIQQAAQQMSTRQVGSILIERDGKPVGIITDKDLRQKVATGLESINSPVTVIMSSPVLTVSEDITVAEAQRSMLINKIKHLCITEDGSDKSVFTGIISEHDIVTLRGNSASFLIKEINRAEHKNQLIEIRKKSSTLLENYLRSDYPFEQLLLIFNEITHSLVHRLIELHLRETVPPVSFAWVSMGSQGRGEQLLLTDQDNALIFENVEDEALEETRNWFKHFARQINEDLHQMGYEYCPANMMASNSDYCLSQKEWELQYQKWITRPSEDSVMMCTIFFDHRLDFGSKALLDKIDESIARSLHTNELFFQYLAKNAVYNPPPVGFFRQFLVEQGGEHKHQFDLKARALMPLIDSARLLIFTYPDERATGTISRFKRLAQLEPHNAALYQQCIESFLRLLKFRTLSGLGKGDSGRYIDLERLSKSERLDLKSCFGPIKDIQEVLKVRFRLSLMS